MANSVDDCVSEPPSKSELSQARWLIKSDHEKEVDDQLWLKIREEAEKRLREFRFDTFSRECSKLLKSDSLESAVANRVASRLTVFGPSSGCSFFYSVNGKDIIMTLREFFLRTFTEDPEIRRAIRDDLGAAIEYQDGKKSYLDCVLSFKFLALQAYRVAHKLWSLNEKFTAKKIQELASKAFLIDIHPGAKIGSGILIDENANGVVIGEKAVIGDNAIIPYYYRESSRSTQKSFHRIDLDRGFPKKYFNLSPGNGQGGESREDSGRQFHAIQVDKSASDSSRSTEKSFNGIDFDGGFHHKLNNLSPGNGQGGERNKDSGRQFHAIQVESDYNPRDEPPLHERSRFWIGTTGEMVQDEWGIDLFGLAKTFLPISAGEGFASLAVRYGTGNSLSEKSKALLSSADVCGVSAFVFCSLGYIMLRSRNRRAKSAARLITVGGVITAIFGHVLMMSSLLTNI